MIILDINKDKLCNKKLVMRVNDKPKEKLIVQVLRDGQVDKWTGFSPTFYGLNAQDKKIMGTKVVRKTDYFEFTFPDNSFSAVGHFKRAYFELRDGDNILTTGDFEIEVINDIGIDKQEAEDIISLNDEIKKVIQDIADKAEKKAQEALDTTNKFDKKLDELAKQNETGSISIANEVINARNGFDTIGKRMTDHEIKTDESLKSLDELSKQNETRNVAIANEVINARNGFDTIGKRMTDHEIETDESLKFLDENKAPKNKTEKDITELSKELRSISIGPKEVFNNAEDLNKKYPNGADSPMLVKGKDGETGYIYLWNGKTWEKGVVYQDKGIANNSIDREKIKIGAVDHSKTNFIDIGKNLFNKNAVTKGFYIAPASGIETENPLYESSDFIDVFNAKKITISSSRFYALYDADYKHVDGGSGGGHDDYGLVTIDIPKNVNFLRTSHRIDKRDKLQVEIGKSATNYEPFIYNIESLKIDKNDINNFQIEPQIEIPEHSISSSKTKFIKTGKNKFNPKKVENGFYVNPGNGELVANVAYDSSEFINVKGQSFISINRCRYYAIYDSFFNFLFSGDGTSENKEVNITNKKNGAYLRTSHIEPYTKNRVQVEFNQKSTQQESYFEFLEGIRTTKTESEINFPQKIYATVGHQLEIFSRNILKENTKDYNVMFTCDFGETTDKSYKIKPTGKGPLDLSFSVFKGEDKAAEKKSTIIMTEKRTTPIFVNVLGDSTINCDGNGEVTKEMLNVIGDNLKLVGTMGEAPNLWEGRRGWTAAMYRAGQEYEGKTNPYYNPGKKDFDYSYYISNNKLSKVDVVVLNLGINDTFAPQTKEKFEEVLPKIKADFEHIFKSIKEYRSDIKIILNLTIPPTDKLDIFYKNYGQNKYRQTQWRYKYNNYEWVKMLIDDYEGKEGMYLVPIFLVIDTFNDIKDGVHPVVEGYKKIGLQVASCINSF